MSTRTICDGCDKTLRARQVVVEGRRVDGLGGGGIPDEFHLCSDCGHSVFDALRVRRTSSSSATPPRSPDDGLACPVHMLPFKMIERTPDGRRICPEGDVWRFVNDSWVAVVPR